MTLLLDVPMLPADAGACDNRDTHPAAPSSRPTPVLHSVVRAFVNTFGITQPTPETEARAGRFIALMLAAVLILLGVVGWLLRAAFSR